MSENGLLTRNFYRFTQVERYGDRAGDWVDFCVKVNGCELSEPPAILTLLALFFQQLVEDLGMRPTSASADEYESTPISATTLPQAKPCRGGCGLLVYYDTGDDPAGYYCASCWRQGRAVAPSRGDRPGEK